MITIETVTIPPASKIYVKMTGIPLSADVYIPQSDRFRVEENGINITITDIDSGFVTLNTVYSNITITGALTPALKLEKILNFFGEPLSGGGGTVSVESEGAAVVTTGTINFEGGGVVVTESPVGVAKVTIAGGGGSQNPPPYKSAEIDFYGVGLPQTLPLFTTEAGKGRFIPTRVTLEMTDITGAPNSANYTTIYANLCNGNTFSTVRPRVITNLTPFTQFDFIPAATLVNIDIDPATLVAIVKGIFRIEGYYEDDYV